MKNLLKAALFLSGAILLTGCVEDEVYTSTYYSRGQEAGSYSSQPSSGYRTSSTRRGHQPASGFYAGAQTGVASTTSAASGHGFQSTVANQPEPVAAPVESLPSNGFSSSG